MHHIYISTYFLTNQAGFGALIQENDKYLQIYGHLCNVTNRCEADILALKEVLNNLPQIKNYSIIHLDCPQTLFILRQGIKNNIDVTRAQSLRQIYFHQNEKKLKFELHQNIMIKKIVKNLAENGYRDYELFHIIGDLVI